MNAQSTARVTPPRRRAAAVFLAGMLGALVLPALLVLSATLVSCAPRPLTVVSDVSSAYYFVEAYNADIKTPLLQLNASENPYGSADANIIISSTPPTSGNGAPDTNAPAVKALSVRASAPIIRMSPRFAKTLLVAFSIPLVVTLRAGENPLPHNGIISLSQLASLVGAADVNAEDARWAFPLAGNEKFAQLFKDAASFEAWISSVPGAENRSRFAAQYEDMPFLAMARDAGIAYKVVPSYDFFRQPQAFQNLFEISLLTDDAGNIPVIDPIFFTAVQSGSFAQRREAKKAVAWIARERSQLLVDDFMKKLSIGTYPPAGFLERSYSNFTPFNEARIFPNNRWLSIYGPRQSLLYFAAR